MAVGERLDAAKRAAVYKAAGIRRIFNRVAAKLNRELRLLHRSCAPAYWFAKCNANHELQRSKASSKATVNRREMLRRRALPDLHPN
jgi:hypothetical protein